jgi:hypothetical protein
VKAIREEERREERREKRRERERECKRNLLSKYEFFVSLMTKSTKSGYLGFKWHKGYSYLLDQIGGRRLLE